MAARCWSRSVGVGVALVLVSVLALASSAEMPLAQGSDAISVEDQGETLPLGIEASSGSQPEPGMGLSTTSHPFLAADSPDERIQRAWRDRGRGLEVRAARLRDVSLSLGILDLDAVARALLLDDSLGTRSERAEAAVLLAPGLPDAHARLAWSRWVDDRDPAAAMFSLRAGLRSLPSHLEGAVWLRATAVDALTRGLLWTGILFLLVAAGAVAPRTVRWAAETWRMPVVSAAAGLGALLLLPAALGEGIAGVSLACGGLAMGWGRIGQRIICVTALAALLIALHPLAAWRDVELSVLAVAPVEDAVHRSERTLATPLDRARVEWAAQSEPLAARALAVLAKRSGDLATADREFRSLLAANPETPEPELLANAANVRLALGDVDEATFLYERAARVSPAPLLLFNLSQVYGRAIRLEEQDLALAEAQTIDSEAVRALISLGAAHDGPAVVDLALPPGAVRARVARAGPKSAPALRSRFAPGVLGGSFVAAALGVLAAVGAGVLMARAVRSSPGRGDSLPQRPGPTDPTVRMARMAARRIREHRLEQAGRVLAGVVPGLCALQKGRPLLGFISVAAAVAMVVCFVARAGVIPDAFAVRVFGGALFVGAACLAAVCYGAATAVSYLIEEAAEPCP